MGVDLHPISTGISSGSSRNGFGKIVSFPSVPSFPAYGTILSTGSEPVTSSFTYTAESPYTTGSFTWGSFPAYTRADGVGGSYLDLTTGYSLGTETAVYNQVMDDIVLQPLTRIIYKGGSGFTEASAGTWSQCYRSGEETGNDTNGNVYVNIAGNDYATGTFETVSIANGICGETFNTTYDYSSYTYGTYIASWYDNASSTTYDSYMDGAGGYYDIPQ